MFSRTVPEKRCGVWRTIPIARLDGVEGQLQVVPPAEPYGASLGLVEPAQEVDDGRLAPSRGPDERDGLPLADVEAEVAEHGLSLLVVEVHVIELDVAGEVRGGPRGVRVGPVADLGHRVDEGEGALRGGNGLLHVGVYPREVLDGPHHEGHVAEECLDPADADEPPPRLQPAEPDDRPDGQCADDLHDGQEQRGEPGGAEARRAHVSGEPGELLEVPLLAAERLHHAHAR